MYNFLHKAAIVSATTLVLFALVGCATSEQLNETEGHATSAIKMAEDANMKASSAANMAKKNESDLAAYRSELDRIHGELKSLNEKMDKMFRQAMRK